MTTFSLAVRRSRRAGTAAVIAAVAVALLKRSYKNARLLWLVKRFIGFALGKVLPIPVPRVVSGAGSTSEIGSELLRLNCKKPLIVTDENLVKFGLVKRAVDSLEKAGAQHELFDTVVPNPPSELVEQGYQIYRDRGCDSIIAFGGGSPMDTAKAIGCKVIHPSRSVKSFQGFFNVNMMGLKPLPPLIAVPTTAGTGSETTVAAIITMTEEKEKIAIADLGLVPCVAVLDPELIEKLPKSVTAATGMDALTHAIESYIGGWTTSFSRTQSTRAVEKIFRNMVPSYADGADLKARQAMLQASFEAGLAFTRANIGYVHGIAHQFGGMFHTAHGVANAMLLPHVLDFYLGEEEGGATCPCTDRLCELAMAGGLADGYDRHDVAAKRALARGFVDRISAMNAEMSLPSEVPEMRASDVTEVATRALKESHGELHGFKKPVAHLFDLGYPVPHYMTHKDCQAIIAKVLPASEKQLWKSSGARDGGA